MERSSLLPKNSIYDILLDMFRQAMFMIFLVACLASAGQAAEVTPDEGGKPHKPKEDAPMTTKMMKDGMLQGDVENAADKKQKEMQPMLEQEEKLMPQEEVNQ